MQLIIIGQPARVIRGPQGVLCTLGSGGLGTISVGTSLAETGSVLLSLGDQAGVLTWTGTTAERQATWASGPTRVGCAPRGTAYYDTTLGAQVFADGVSSTNWSSTSSAGV
jgi:hypothetical protein